MVTTGKIMTEESQYLTNNRRLICDLGSVSGFRTGLGFMVDILYRTTGV